MRECRSAGAAGSPQALAEEVPGVARHISVAIQRLRSTENTKRQNGDS